MFIISEESSLTLTPTLEGRTAGRVDKNSDSTFTMSAQEYETNKWVTVTVRASNDFTHSTSDLHFWPLGSYSKNINYTECYLSAISFFTEDPNAEAEKPTQDIRFISVLKDSDLTNYSAVGYKVIANGIEQIVESTVVYTSVVGAAQTYAPDHVGGSYFSVVRIDDVPIGDAITFTVIAYVKTVDDVI